METKTIIIVLPGNLPVPCVSGGAIETIAQLTLDQNERQKRFQFVVFSPHDRAAKILSQRYDQARFVWIRRGALYSLLNFFIKVLRKTVSKGIDHLDGQILRRRIGSIEFDRVIVYGSPNHLMALSKVVPRNKLDFYAHTNLFYQPTPLNAAIGRAAGRFLCVSNFVRQEIVRNTDVPAENVTVIRNPIDFSSFTTVCGAERPTDLVAKHGIRSEDVVLLFVGRIVEGKGIIPLLRALAEMPSDVNFKLLVVGSFGSDFGQGKKKDGFHEKVMTLARTMGSKIIFTGFMHNSALPPYHALADIVLMPSLCEEAAGMVAMEAMASGRPVIASDAGGITEYVTEGCGIIIKRDDHFISGLSSAILDLIENPKNRLSMGRAGALAARKFSPDEYFEAYVKLMSYRD
jgi:glycosyltransferase involved in cell wall biosynthesis